MQVHTNSRRFHEFNALLITGLTIFIMLTLVACGGSDANGQPEANIAPVYHGATKLDDANATKQEVADLGFKASDVTATAYKSQDAFDLVASFYTEGVEDEGWRVDSELTMGDQAVAVLTKGKQVIYVMLAHGQALGEFVDSIQSDELEIDASAIKDGDTVIVFLEMTCDEATVATCATFGA